MFKKYFKLYDHIIQGDPIKILLINSLLSIKQLTYGAIDLNFMSSCFDQYLCIWPPCTYTLVFWPFAIVWINSRLKVYGIGR